MYDDRGMYVRPLDMFLSEVDHEKYPNVTQEYRFEKIQTIIATCGANPTDSFFKGIRKITDEKGCRFLGQYICTGYDTFGPFKLVGGLKRGHPDADEIRGAVDFYGSL